MGKKVLIVGGGGREHAFAESLSQSPSVDSIICTPGNAGTSGVAKCRNIPSSSNAQILDLALAESVTLVVPGPEAPLASGLVDILGDAGIPAFGPSADSARLESSKGFAKDFMARNSVATADYIRCSDPETALKTLDRFGFPVVIKADGLAAGKGVLICGNRTEAEEAVKAVMVKRDFGDAGDQLVIEQCLVGWETSIIGFVDGKSFLPFLPAKDHKRAGEGDIGLNTGGMGVIAPHPLVDTAVMDNIRNNIIIPTMAGLKTEGLEYSGFLFIGVMVTSDGVKALEYNVRFGDPEAQALLPLLDGDLDRYMDAAMEGRLGDVEPLWRGGASCCVIMASGGYPGPYETGFIIHGIQGAQQTGCEVYCAGVSSDEQSQYRSGGGRVLGVTALGTSPEEARIKAYKGIDSISFKDGWFRRDIGI